jgi:pimeloyl-ACP methyl ester carboxylesterase
MNSRFCSTLWTLILTSWLLVACTNLPEPTFEAIPWRVEDIKTADGFIIKARHYVRSEGVPVILQHGVCNNHSFWDLAMRKDSLARFLFQLGYDVWVTTNRGQGRDELKSPAPNRWTWNVDDLAIFDISAIVDTVSAQTGQPPFYVGHSLGGITMLMYLQGIEYNTQKRIIARAELAKERNQKLRGFVDVAGPGAFPDWEKAGGASCWVRYPGQCFSGCFSWLPKFPAQWGSAFARCTLLSTKLNSVALNPDNITTNQTAFFVKHGLDPCSMKVIKQFIEFTKSGKLQEDCDGCPNPYIYSDHLDQVQLPVLVIAGTYDVLRLQWLEETYRRIGSSDKDIRFVPHGHLDEGVGITTARDVYQPIADWLARQLKGPKI